MERILHLVFNDQRRQRINCKEHLLSRFKPTLTTEVYEASLLGKKLIKQRIRRCDSPTLRSTTPITLNYSQGKILRTPNCGMSAFFNPQKPTAEGQRWSFPTMSLSPYACVQDCLARQHYSFCLQAHQSLTDLRLKRRKGN